LGYSDLCAETGFYLGYSRTSGNWTAGQLAEIDAIVQAGYRKFLFFAPPGAPMYRWSFLYKWTTLTCTADDYDNDLPDDFGNLDGPIRYNPDQSGVEIKETNAHQIVGLRESNNDAGLPYLYAVRSKSSTQATGQRCELLLYPKPDSTYVLAYCYQVLTNKLATAYPYPLGGMAHSQTVLEFCLWQAELSYYEMPNGPHAQAALTAFQASMAQDLRMQPSRLGYMSDPGSEDRWAPARSRNCAYSGVVPS
jgi:hypothetical protein